MRETAEKYEKLLNDWRSSDQKGKRRIEGKIIALSEGFVTSEAVKHIKGNFNHLEDAEQEIRLAILKAIKKWDPQKAKEKGAHFLTYAGYWARRYGQLFYNNIILGPVRVSEGTRLQNARKMAELTEDQKLGSEEKYNLLKSFPRYTRLDSFPPLREDIPGGKGPTIDYVLYKIGYISHYNEEKVNDLLSLDKIRDLLKDLPDRLQTIITGRMAGRTLQQIGQELDLTRERVRQLESRAIKTLRRKTNR